jgi:hypothetical protein
MKLPDTQQEVETLGESDQQDFTMDESSMHLAMDAFVQYKEPIDSLVREITSNGFDAHAEAQRLRDLPLASLLEHSDWDSLPSYQTWTYFQEWLSLLDHLEDWEESGVIVRMSEKYPSGGERKIEIEDRGVGMAPRHSDIEPNVGIYTTFFESTKRDTNDKIGTFGIGAKSPLGYTDMFEVISRFNGTKYHYVVSKGEKVPRMDLVDQEPTDEPNGTTVRVNMKSVSDWRSFKDACKKQLAYFPNVLFEGALSGKVSNDFNIYEGQNFVFRTDNPFNELHMCIGGVYYPLDYEAVDLGTTYSKRQKWNVPIALKFDIGELPILWNRENVKYTEEAKGTIKERISDVQDELQSIFDDCYGDNDTVGEWLNAWNASQGSTVDLTEDVSLSFTEKFIASSDVPEFETYENILPKLPGDPFYLAKIYKKIDKGYVYQGDWSKKLKECYFKGLDGGVYYWVENRYSPKTNRYINWEHGLRNFYLIKPNIDVNLDLSDDEDKSKAVRRFKTYYSEDFVAREDISDLQLKTMLHFERKVLKLIRSKCRDYSTEEPTDEFKEIDKNRDRKNGSSNSRSMSKKKRQETFPCKMYSSGGSYSGSKWSQKRMKWKKIHNPDLIIYGHRKHGDDLLDVGDVFHDLSYLSDYRSNGFKTDRVWVMKIAKSRVEHFEALDTSIFIDNVWDHYWGFLRRKYTKEQVNNIVNPSRIPDGLSKMFPRVNELSETLNSELNNTGGRLPTWIKDEIDTDKYVDHRYLRMAKELKGWVLKYPLFKALNRYRAKKNMPSHATFDEEIQSYIESKSECHPLLTYRYHQHNQQTSNG